jgi:hypothetical protein
MATATLTKKGTRWTVGIGGNSYDVTGCRSKGNGCEVTFYIPADLWPGNSPTSRLQSGQYDNVMFPAEACDAMGCGGVVKNTDITYNESFTSNVDVKSLKITSFRDMTLPLSTERPIRVTELTPNLQEIQSFPIAGKGLDGTHFHQDPETGQMYVMSAEFHDMIPRILMDRESLFNNNNMTMSTPDMNISTNGMAVIMPTNTIDLNSIDDYITLSDNSSQFLIYDVPSNNEIIKSNVVDIGVGGVMEYDNISYLTEMVYLTPINSILNVPTSRIVDVQFAKYIPINRFINTIRQTIGYDFAKLFIPINRFNNK